MAKKSAKSKGFRKTQGKKPYLSRRDIIILCVILAVVAVGAILLFSYDDGALKTKDGTIVGAGENWLVINGSNSGGRRYYKLGEAGELDGYTRESAATLTDANLRQYTYTPEAEGGDVVSISVSASPYAAERLAQSTSQVIGSLDGCEASAVSSADADGLEYSYYTYTNVYAEAEAADAAPDADPEDAAEDAAPAEAEPNRFEKSVCAYIPAAHDGSVVITVLTEAEDADGFLSDEALLDAVARAAGSITLEAK